MNKQRELMIALAGGLVFAIVGIGLDFLFSEDPSFVRGIVGGLAFAGTWIVVSLMRRRSEEGDE